MKRTTRTIALASLVALASCSATVGQKATIAELQITAKVCDTFAPITYDGKLDTPPTKAQIKKYNAKRAVFCQINP